VAAVNEVRRGGVDRERKEKGLKSLILPTVCHSTVGISALMQEGRGRRSLLRGCFAATAKDGTRRFGGVLGGIGAE
jgi:hypothetical protein